MKILLFFASFIAASPLFSEESMEELEELISSKINLAEVFQGSPLIYTVLIVLSIFSLVTFLYTLINIKVAKMMPEEFVKQIREQIAQKKYDAALKSCRLENHFSSTIISSGILARKHGHQVMMEAMQAEGKRCGATLWQRISLLNDVAAVAPMLGLLGTVVGMFYAFYDVNRSVDTLSSIFDGLGIAIGTTVAGLIVAILAMVFFTSLKYKVIRLLNTIENEAVSLGNMMETE